MQNFDKKKKPKFIRKFLILFIIVFIYFLLVYKFFELSYLNSFYINQQSKIRKFYDNKISIFTFWEPSTKFPGYLQLCINTWKRNIPNYNITILDYSKLHKYLNSSIISKILCKNMTLPIQADAIRVAMLEKYGGIWMDIDIIITSFSFLKNVFKYDLAFYGNPQKKNPTISFIYASKNSRIMKEWLINIIKRVSIYKKLQSQKYNNLTNLCQWNYLGNGIINELLKKSNEKEFIIFDWLKENAIPERNAFHAVGKMAAKGNFKIIEAYRNFYFYPGDPQKIINNNTGIIFLHNSWTEKKYKYMSIIEFLRQNIMLSNLFKKLLEKE